MAANPRAPPHRAHQSSAWSDESGSWGIRAPEHLDQLDELRRPACARLRGPPKVPSGLPSRRSRHVARAPEQLDPLGQYPTAQPTERGWTKGPPRSACAYPFGTCTTGMEAEDLIRRSEHAGTFSPPASTSSRMRRATEPQGMRAMNPMGTYSITRRRHISFSLKGSISLGFPHSRLYPPVPKSTQETFPVLETVLRRARIMS